MAADTWGEARWTARDVVDREHEQEWKALCDVASYGVVPRTRPDEFVVTDYYGAIHGQYAAEGDALERRNALNAVGVETWVMPAAEFRIEDECEAPAFLTNRDPGDETDWRDA